MNKFLNKKKILIVFILFFVFALPILSFAQPADNGLVPCGNEDPVTGAITKPCDFNGFIELVNKVINFLVFILALPIAAIMFAFAGFKLVTSGGGESKAHAKEMFFNTVLGIIIALAAWLIVHTILTILGYNGSWIGF